VLDVGPGALVQDVPVALQLRPDEDRRYRRGQHHAPHRAGDGVVEAAFHVKVGAEDRQGAERRRRLRGPGPPAWSVEGDGYAPAMVSGGAGCVERAGGGVEVAGSRTGGGGAGGRPAATRAEGRWRPGARADGRRRWGRTGGSGASGRPMAAGGARGKAAAARADRRRRRRRAGDGGRVCVRVRCVSQGSADLDKSLTICRVPDQVCRVPEIRHSAKPFSKKKANKLFAECWLRGHSAKPSFAECQVRGHTAKNFF